MTKTVIALYDEFQTAQDAVQDLVNSGVRRDDISLVANDAHGEHSAQLRKHASGAGEGAGQGAVVGGLAGLLVGLGALAIPGVGPILAAGPLAATLAGAGVGAVAGGLVGVLLEAGVPEDEAQVYAEGVRRGGTLLAVRCANEQADSVRDTLNRHAPVDVQTRANEWHQTGWRESKLDRDANDEGVPAQVGGDEADVQPPNYGTSPRQIDEQIGPERVDSPYGGAEYANVERTGADYTPAPQIDIEAQRRAPESLGARPLPAGAPGDQPSEGIGLSSGAGQSGAGTQAGGSAEENASGNSPARSVESFDADFQRHYDAVYSDGSRDYSFYRPAYRYGYQLAQGARFQNRRWSEIEPEARQEWDTAHPQDRWDDFKEAIRYGWERVMSATGNQSTTNGADWTGQGSRLDRPSYQGPEERRI